MLGQALQQTFADLSTALLVAAVIAVAVAAVGLYLRYDYRQLCQRLEETRPPSQSLAEPVVLAEEIKVHDRTRRGPGPSAEDHLGKPHVGERSV